MATPAAPSPQPPTAPSQPPTRPVSLWFVMAIAVMGVLAGAIAVVALKSSAPDQAAPVNRSSTIPSETAPDGASAPSDATVVPATVTPKWTGGIRRERGRNVAVYEVEANNEVPVYGKVVRPLLTVRCVAGTTEVFVLTQSASALESNDGRHTVKVGFDAGGDVTERWLASADYDALFAEDGVAAARRMRGARTMRFNFTPFNGAPQTARFDVAGFDEIAAKLTQTCRWK